jgi:hypothetical protein
LGVGALGLRLDLDVAALRVLLALQVAEHVPRSGQLVPGDGERFFDGPTCEASLMQDETVDAWKHHIEDQEIMVAGGGSVQAVGSSSITRIFIALAGFPSLSACHQGWSP